MTVPPVVLREPNYPLARSIAARARAYFQRHLAEAREAGRENDPACLPSTDEMETIIEAAFWASLRREEGYPPKISLAFLAPDQAPLPMIFDRSQPLAAASLSRLAPAVERPGVHLGVWRERGALGPGELRVWGTTHLVPAYCFVLEVVRPGLLVVKCPRGHGAGKFANVAVLDGDRTQLVDSSGSALPDCPSVVRALLGADSARAPHETPNVLVELAVSMRAHGRGGTLLVVPADSAGWRESVVHPIGYAVAPAYRGLVDLVARVPEGLERHSWEESLRGSITAIAGLTAVDGATVMSDRYEVFAFGAKISRHAGAPRVERVLLSEPIEGASATIVETGVLGGTRHLSAAQFVMDQRDATALVASQDGPFTVFAWSSFDEMVHAYRVESLLL